MPPMNHWRKLLPSHDAFRAASVDSLSVDISGAILAGLTVYCPEFSRPLTEAQSCTHSQCRAPDLESLHTFLQPCVGMFPLLSVLCISIRKNWIRPLNGILKLFSTFLTTHQQPNTIHQDIRHFDLHHHSSTTTTKAADIDIIFSISPKKVMGLRMAQQCVLRKLPGEIRDKIFQYATAGEPAMPALIKALRGSSANSDLYSNSIFWYYSRNTMHVTKSTIG